jgi:hypothetical protein
MTRFHVGLDHAGHRHLRLRNISEVRRAREMRLLFPVVIIAGSCHGGQARWRNGMHHRRWLIVTGQVRGDRRGFLMTLRRPPLVPPVRPF